MSSSSVQHIGSHRLVIRGNLAEVTITGTVTEAELADLFARYDRVADEHGHVCILADLTGTRGVDPRARRLAAEWARRNARNFHTAIYGGSRPIRALMTLLLGAVRILGGQPAPVALFETAEEGRCWLAPYRTSPSTPELAAR